MPSVSEILLNDDLFVQSDKFTLLKSIADSREDINDLAVLTAMRLKANEWDGFEPIASGIVRSSGLFPYLPDVSSADIDFKDALAKEMFKSESRDAYLHQAQQSVLNHLMGGESVILSAPTSFGKSFIIEELLLSSKFDNVAIIVPTVALIEEIRQKVKKLHLEHKRISFTNQELSEKNVFILTQERAYEMYGTIASLGLDLLVIDEFYKMDSNLLSRDDSSDRADMLSVVYHRLSQVSKQVYLLGPFIDGANGYKTEKHDPIWIESDASTTFIIKKKLTARNMDDRGDTTARVAVNAGQDVMIYLSSPATLRSFYKNHLSEVLENNSDNDDLIEWIEHNIGDEWYITNALKKGVGVHHGQIPRFLAHEMIKRFSDGRIKILLCTSSLIEGVNTCAQTIIIHNGRQRFNGDILTFRNISGRAGRMFNHFWGTVYYYEEPSSNTEIVVNDPIGSVDGSASPSTLSLLDDNQLTQRQRESVSTYRGESYIPDELQRSNYFIDITLQQQVVDLLNSTTAIRTILTSIKTPNLLGSQLTTVLKLCSMLGLNTFSYAHAQNNNVDNSVTRLKIILEAFFNHGFRGLCNAYTFRGPVNDDSIENSFRFIKNGMSYDLPKYVRALNRLQQYAYGNTAGDLEPLASRIEYLDTKPVYVHLDELGLPIEFSQKYHLPDDNTDSAVNALAHILPNLTGFEHDIASDFLQHY